MPGPRLVIVVLGGLALGAWCGWVSGFHRGTSAATATWTVTLAAVVAVDLLVWQGRRGRRPGLRLDPAETPWPRPGRAGRLALAGASPWLGLAAVVAAWEVLGIDTGRHTAHLTLSALAQAFRPLNAALVMVWMLVGIGYGVARARAPEAVGRRVSDRRGGAGDTTSPGFVLLTHGPATAPGLLLPDSRPVGVGFWIGVLAVGVTVDLVARRSRGQVATAEEFVRFVTGPPLVNALLVLAWTLAGYHLFAH